MTGYEPIVTINVEITQEVVHVGVVHENNTVYLRAEAGLTRQQVHEVILALQRAERTLIHNERRLA